MALNQNTLSLVSVDQICELSTNYLESQCPCSSNVHKEEGAQADKPQSLKIL